MWPSRRDKPPKKKWRYSHVGGTVVGLVYVGMMLFLGAAAFNTGSNLLYGVFGLMIGVFLLSIFVSKRVLRGLEVHRVVPDHAVVGVPSAITYQFHNTKRLWPSLAVTAAEVDGVTAFTRPPQGYLLHAPPRTQASVPTEVIPRRRGMIQLDRYRLITSFPFGFVRRTFHNRQPDKLLVYPALGTADKAVLALCRAAETTGAPMRPRPGGQDEFYGVKEHRAGDSPRNIYWKRSARTAASGVLVAREMSQVTPPRVLILVDTWLVDKTPAARAAVERAIASAATLIDSAIEDDLSVGLIAWANGWKRVDPSRGKRHRSDVMSLLAKLPQNTRTDTKQLLDQSRRFLHAGTTAILFTPRDMPAGAEGPRRNAVIVIPTEGDEARRWFTFSPAVNFAAGLE